MLSIVALSLLALGALAVWPSLCLPYCSTLLGARQYGTAFTLQELLTLLTLLLAHLTCLLLLYCRHVNRPRGLRLYCDFTDFTDFTAGKLKAKGLETLGMTTNGITLSKQVSQCIHAHMHTYSKASKVSSRDARADDQRHNAVQTGFPMHTCIDMYICACI